MFFLQSAKGILYTVLQVLLPSLLFFCSTVHAAEVIERYDVKAVMAIDGKMLVTEEITVLAERQKIKRGIFRKFPRTWYRQDGEHFVTQYTVREVLRDGKPEPYSENISTDFVNIKIGNPNRILPPGRYTYTLVYEVANHFSRFPEFDELYWNVTGNDWDFSIQRASFSLSFAHGLNSGADAIDVAYKTVDIYTGLQGYQERNAQIRSDNSVVTTRPLRRGEGLTVVYTWDRGVLAAAPDPIETNLLRDLFVPNGYTVILWIIPILFGVFSVFYRQKINLIHGKPEVIPLFSPPAKLSPGFLRAVTLGRYDNKAFASDLLHLIAKGGLRFVIGARGKPIKELERGAPKEPLSAVERKVIDILLPKENGSISLSTPYQAKMSDACGAFSSVFQEKKKEFYTKRWPVSAAFGICCILLFVMAIGFFRTSGLLPAVMIVGFVLFFSAALVKMTSLQFSQVEGLLDFFGLLARLLFFVPFYIAVGALAFFLFPLVMQEAVFPVGMLGALLLLIGIWVIFLFFMPKRTDLGEEHYTVAQGLKLYLGTAEEKRYEALYPPADSVERFEQLLPYALALGVGKTWADRFAQYLETHSEEVSTLAMHSWSDIQSFSKQTSRASSSRSVSSSSSSGYSGSGSSGRGSSGGGSGGGGGGGW